MNSLLESNAAPADGNAVGLGRVAAGVVVTVLLLSVTYATVASVPVPVHEVFYNYKQRPHQQ